MELSSARVLITGAARGIGNYIANDLLLKVQKVIIIDHNQELLDKIPENDRAGINKLLEQNVVIATSLK